MTKSILRSIRVAFFLAVKSITRGNIGITLLTIAMLILVYMNMMFVPGLIQGIVTSANDKLVTTYSADIIIEAEGDNPTIRHINELTSSIEAIPGVIAASASNKIGAELTFEDERTGCAVTAINPDKEKATLDIEQWIVEGDYLEPRDMDEILLGIQLAGSDRPELELYSSSLRYVHAGDKVKVKYNNGLEKQYTVKGIFQVQFVQSDLQAFISEREYQSVVPQVRNSATSIRVRLEENVDPQWVISQIEQIRSGLKFQTWEDTAGIVRSMTDSFNIIQRILYVVNLLVAGITIFIVVYVDIVNRRRQIGIQRAIGITPQSITLSYILRALFYVFVGMIVGSMLFTYVVVPFEARHPFHFPLGDVYIYVSYAYKIRIALVLLAVSLISAFLPVRRTMKINLIDAIWG
jgi:putative ABC transport system permease protein